LVDSTIVTREWLHRSFALLLQFEPTIEISEGTGSILVRLFECDRTANWLRVGLKTFNSKII